MFLLPYILSMSQTTVIMAVATMMLTMPETTADVVALPTADALRPHCTPRRQPASPTRHAENEAAENAYAYVRQVNRKLCLVQYSNRFMSRPATATMRPPRMPMRSA